MNNRGFTLLELIIVVIILGILISIAIPQFIGTKIKAESAEAFNILGTYRSAQMRYYQQWENYTTDCTKLDVESTSLKYHSSLACYNGNGGSGSDIVTIASTSNSYTLGIDVDGNISCSGTDCSRIGYSSSW